MRARHQRARALNEQQPQTASSWESCALLGESVQAQDPALRINTDKLELVAENLRFRHLDRSEAKFGLLAGLRIDRLSGCRKLALPNTRLSWRAAGIGKPGYGEAKRCTGNVDRCAECENDISSGRRTVPEARDGSPELEARFDCDLGDSAGIGAGGREPATGGGGAGAATAGVISRCSLPCGEITCCGRLSCHAI